MVPGLVSHLDIQWQQTGCRRFVRALERGGRLIRLDKRVTGLSDPCAELPTTQERVRDVAAVMAAARSSRAVLFGLSDGGRAAIAFAAAHPGRTQGLILYGASYRGPRAALLRRYPSMGRARGGGGPTNASRPGTGPPGPGGGGGGPGGRGPGRGGRDGQPPPVAGGRPGARRAPGGAVLRAATPRRPAVADPAGHAGRHI